ncbi:hypothetical protein [Gordonia neofelifaecis]|uniref:Uncharacterized protein n=1 Tax=Gordonia neofelifaecis NRRL B-59395 TaxID=644548 RepID=F1YFI5_9ACTN|nr:hypothetical protein [Gordonia neofelifaecis]EGD56473.1 hypothetical protein SCNU_02942 [Gordonia neofelifaecis NRRL B-59395]
MDIAQHETIRLDLDDLARLTVAQREVVSTLADCASALDDGDLCDWGDVGPPRRAADTTLECLHDLAARLRGCGIAVDAVAADLGRANRDFEEAEATAVVAVRGRSQ